MATSKQRKKVRKDTDETASYFDTFDDLSLSRINGEINKMTKNCMIELLKRNHLHTKGVKEVLNRRLKNYYKKQRIGSRDDCCQYYKNLIVVDFEATCERKNEPEYLHEIIEFPAILLDAETGNIIDEFHSYCRPVLNPVLSEFCTSLTGISQSEVDRAPEFATVFQNFETWLRGRDLLSRRNTAFISDGPWDFSRFLNIQCCLSGVSYPKWGKKWINLKKVYGNFYKMNRPKLEEMLSNLGLKFEGRLHNGLDDARNISKIVERLISDGCILELNERLNAGKYEAISENDRQRARLLHGTMNKQSTSTKLLPLEPTREDSDKENQNTSSTPIDDDVHQVTHKISLCSI